MRYANEVPNDDLYIPHGSDESDKPGGAKA